VTKTTDEDKELIAYNTGLKMGDVKRRSVDYLQWYNTVKMSGFILQ